MKYSAFAIVVLCALSGLSKAEQAYTVKNEAVECFNGDVDSIYHCELKLVGRQRLLNGTMSVDEDMTSEHYTFQVEVFTSPLGDDQFRLLPMGVPRTGVCEGLRYLYTKQVQPSVIQGKHTNFPFVPEEGLCPIPKGEYFIKNIEYDTDSWPNQIPRGVIKTVITFFKDGVNIGGYVIRMLVEDRE
ncbi:PREDICTED: uncharacterized protein LOC108374724 [Rhagoletis zephyria]|uniref:uncharacterized protein LOC108374724 n=1 Tax=Rhagoletis zephyria TaxID=28612 RepID=UPI00081186DB|nr:PREDICTED: uncharacterized protein LOC108374724 [Rhagoletis zephyria]